MITLLLNATTIDSYGFQTRAEALVINRGGMCWCGAIKQRMSAGEWVPLGEGCHG